jgi:hypothetical protein
VQAHSSATQDAAAVAAELSHAKVIDVKEQDIRLLGHSVSPLVMNRVNTVFLRAT